MCQQILDLFKYIKLHGCAAPLWPRLQNQISFPKRDPNIYKILCAKMMEYPIYILCNCLIFSFSIPLWLDFLGFWQICESLRLASAADLLNHWAGRFWCWHSLDSQEISSDLAEMDMWPHYRWPLQPWELQQKQGWNRSRCVYCNIFCFLSLHDFGWAMQWWWCQMLRNGNDSFQGLLHQSLQCKLALQTLLDVHARA